LQSDAVAIAAGELEDRLDAGFDQHRRRGHRAEMWARAGAIGDVHRVCQALERQRLGKKFAAIGCDRRRDFRRDHEALGAQFVLEVHRHPSRKIQWTWQAQE
jgi:hypothetical protein